jgi:membrane fusion protein (multidrug efflux system)
MQLSFTISPSKIRNLFTRYPYNQMAIAAVGMLGVLALLGGIKYIQIQKAMAEHASFAMPPEAVTTHTAQVERWFRAVDGVGTLTALHGTTLSAEEEGRVEKISVESGSEVTAGQVILTLDTSVEEANLKAAIARGDKAQRALTRARALTATQAIAKELSDNAEAEFREAQGNIESLTALIRRKKIIAPFAGKIGVRSVQEGTYVTKGTPIVSLYATKELYVNFVIPQSAALGLTPGLTVEVSSDMHPGKVIQAKLLASDPQVDEQTRTVKIQAYLANTDDAFKPGSFVRTRLIFTDSQEVVPVPASSISYAPYGDTVYIAEQMTDEKGAQYLGVRQQIVKLGGMRGDQVAILSGVKAGDVVVSSGTFKLRPRAAITVNNEVAPANDPAPRPENT